MNTKNSEKQKRYRQRQKERGLVEFKAWVTPEDKAELASVACALKRCREAGDTPVVEVHGTLCT